MDDKKMFYESPVIQVIEMNMETIILDASLSGTRRDYGTANEDTWD